MATQGVHDFTLGVRTLLDPISPLSQQYPELHFAFQTRFKTAWALRGEKNISKCLHRIFNDYDIGRSDGETYQKHENSRLVDVLAPHPNDNTMTRVNQICEIFGETMEVYGLIGYGTFGVVYLARERSETPKNPYDLKHYAVKVERHTTYLTGQRWIPVSMVPIWDNDVQLATYIPSEALALFLLSYSERFPMLDSMYTHDRFTTMVMSAGVDDAADRRENVQGDPHLRFPAFTGVYLMARGGKPLLNEMQASKVSGLLLQAFVHLAEFNLIHNDISVNNFIIDQNLDVQLIDFGNVAFGTAGDSFRVRAENPLHFQEYQITPDQAYWLAEREEALELGTRFPPGFTHDCRQLALWKFGVIVYGMLHGYWPWDDATAQSQSDLLGYDGMPGNKRVWRRRMRMVGAEELELRRGLSKECQDVLKYMLTWSEVKPVTLEALVTFPWFTRWQQLNCVWERPLSYEFLNKYSEVGGRPRG